MLPVVRCGESNLWVVVAYLSCRFSIGQLSSQTDMISGEFAATLVTKKAAKNFGVGS
jgi:hypothetical protein